jgi:hypothetical protein
LKNRSFVYIQNDFIEQLIKSGTIRCISKKNFLIYFVGSVESVLLPELAGHGGADRKLVLVLGDALPLAQLPRRPNRRPRLLPGPLGDLLGLGLGQGGRGDAVLWTSVFCNVLVYIWGK